MKYRPVVTAAYISITTNSIQAVQLITDFCIAIVPEILHPPVPAQCTFGKKAADSGNCLRKVFTPLPGCAAGSIKYCHSEFTKLRAEVSIYIEPIRTAHV